jgi:hypothetical protein
MNKVGRNAPCPCGSGKKYKKCCLVASADSQIEPVPVEIIKRFQEHQHNEIEREKLYGKTRPIIHNNFKGYKLVAVGSQMHWAKEEKWKTFPDFLLDYIKTTLGRDWGNAELKKPLEERHQILKLYDAMCRFQQKQTKDEDGIYEAIPNGAFAAYLSLAYDLYILRHHKALQEDIIRRLKHPDQYQGARYELFATATCIRAGFKIEFENEKDGSRKHPEFIATHIETGQKISVEAKSKHREGVLGFPGQQESDEEIKLRIGSLINQALKKESNYPFVIFVDVNIPPSVAERTLEVPPPNGIARTLDQIAKAIDGKDLFNLILFTNHPHHYGRSDEPDQKKNVLAVISQKPKTVLTYPELLFSLNQAALQYGHIPNEFPKD